MSNDHVSFDQIITNKAHYAKKFSEGNIPLERLLMHCFDNNIKTYMCCSGNEYEPAFLALHVPYSY